MDLNNRKAMMPTKDQQRIADLENVLRLLLANSSQPFAQRRARAVLDNEPDAAVPA